MKFTKISAAVALLAIGAAAQAAPTAIAYSAGATAIQKNQADALAALCVTNNSGYVMTKLRASGASNDNFVSYVCASAPVTLANYATATYANFAPGIPFQEIRYNADLGSFAAVLQINNQNLAYFDPATGANITPNPASIVKLGGALDVEPAAFTAETIGSLTLPETVGKLGVAQAFGVGVSKPLYAAMYAAQLSTGDATIEKPIPSSCGADPEAVTGKIACIPTISKGQMASIMANTEGSAYSLGAQFLAPQLPAGTELSYARRVDTSGTQAAAQNYFLGLPCSTAPLGVVSQGATGTGTSGGTKISNIRVYGLGSTGNVRTVLSRESQYSIGIVSGENNQTDASGNWRWLRVQGAAMGENSQVGHSSIGNRLGVTSGSYDFYYETTYVLGDDANGESSAYWDEIKAAINGLVPPLGVGLIDGATLGAGFNKLGLTCAANLSN